MQTYKAGLALHNVDLSGVESRVMANLCAGVYNMGTSYERMAGQIARARYSMDMLHARLEVQAWQQMALSRGILKPHELNPGPLFDYLTFDNASVWHPAPDSPAPVTPATAKGRALSSVWCAS